MDAWRLPDRKTAVFIMYELKLQKDKIRTQYIDMRRKIDENEKSERDAKIRSLFMALVTYRYCDTLLLYVPTKREIDVMPLALSAIAAGKKVAFPACDTSIRTMEFRYVTDPKAQLTNMNMSISEPDKSCPVYSPGTGHAVCLVPAIVYDGKGYRLGYGKGYYDRYLVNFTGTKVGFVYSDFIVDSVPRGRYDLAVDVLVTDKGVKALNAK